MENKVWKKSLSVFEGIISLNLQIKPRKRAQTSVTLVAAVFFPSDIRVSFYLCFIFRRRLARAQCVHL